MEKLSGTMKTLPILFFSALAVVGCTEQGGDSNRIIEMPRFSDAQLAKGRAAWMGTCRNCHLLGVSGAPAVTDYATWAPRIAKGREALHGSALSGIRDSDGNIRMPQRGGNPRLSDEQVKQAVDYMVSSVQYLNNEDAKP